MPSFNLTKGEVLSMIEALSAPEIVDTFNAWELDFYGKILRYACSNEFRALTEKQEGSLIAVYASHVIKPNFAKSNSGKAYLAKAKAEVEAKKKAAKATPKASPSKADDEPPF